MLHPKVGRDAMNLTAHNSAHFQNSTLAHRDGAGLAR